MNWLRIILDGVLLCIAFNGVAAFVWLLEPEAFAVMLPKGINTSPKDIPLKKIMPLRVMELVIYPIFIAYMVLSSYEAGITGFGNLFWTAFIENLFWNFGDFFILDWWFREKYADRIKVPGTEDNELWETGPWMKRFGIVDHWVKWPIICIFLSLIIAGIGMWIR